MSVTNLEHYDPKKYILVKNVQQNNLKNLDIALKHNKLIIITGVSGSGKSSLAFETLYEEGRRRYVESLSSYVRQFLGKIKKPHVDFIKGLPPAIAIEQKRSTSNSRSTIGTVTEIYDYLKLLYARIGKTYSPVSGKEVKRYTLDDIVDFIVSSNNGSRVKILNPIIRSKDRTWQEELAVLLQKGFSRLLLKGKIIKAEELLTSLENAENKTIVENIESTLNHEALILVDRITLNSGNNTSRIADSVQTAIYEGKGRCFVELEEEGQEGKRFSFSNSFELDGIVFEEPAVDLFAFNSPHGACKVCGGMGDIIGIDEKKVIPNRNISLYDGAVVCWEGEKMSKWKRTFINTSAKYDFPIFKPYNELNDKNEELLWKGNSEVPGINAFFDFVESKSYKMHYRIFMSRFKGKTTCRECKGIRLRKEVEYVKIGDKSIGELVIMPISELSDFFRSLKLTKKENEIAKRLLFEINNRLKMMLDVGLDYLNLNRTTRSISGGELQRIQLIYSIGSNLTGSLYILDEPSIGLHPRDGKQLINVLRGLRSLGNTVIVVEHDEEIIRSADEIIDLGPNAGTDGGELIFQGSLSELLDNKTSITARYLNGLEVIPVPKKRRKGNGHIKIIGADKFNLKKINVTIPLEAITVVTGVSGSGKTTLVREVIFETFRHEYSMIKQEPQNCSDIEGNYSKITKAEFVGQEGIDRSRRSNPVTYIKVFDHIRDLFAKQQISKIKGYTPAYFSFNVDGGRCDECKGDGKITIEMQFVADLHLECEECKGKRYKEEILEITHNNKNIHEILNMTVKNATEFFKEYKAIKEGLKPLIDVGLDYLLLGQPTSTLSGGEAQRLKLATFLAKGNKKNESILFIFDEPTTGLHWHDIHNLLKSFNALIEIGHSVLIIEHNLEIIKCADYVIDLGKEGGEKGGEVLFQGTPEGLCKVTNSYTAQFLKKKLQVKQ